MGKDADKSLLFISALHGGKLYSTNNIAAMLQYASWVSEYKQRYGV